MPELKNNSGIEFLMVEIRGFEPLTSFLNAIQALSQLSYTPEQQKGLY